ncbi:type IV pilus assembly protein FimV [Pseudoxanthomonas daejeonensis]|uniref:Ferrous iron transporter B n=1 Tax=Pseudoxanthomonas daejeonensis TaxID=266062 RepID=A0ABQ6Z9B5_9GAMM|nr:FimV/HubP family polar landmark protein [Pseudoxanthomonas daejeonensis]KAF1696062.1 ferrous iron transporter B [Pseudoxanthomonas daejeonensis]
MSTRGRGATRPWHWLLAIGLSLLSSGAMALGLGQIRVLSSPGQPLLAEIPIISNEPGELENARARLASPETFARVGLQPPSGLVNDLQFEITSDAQGRAVVRVTSSAPVDVPALGFLVEVDWGQGRLVREYSALVNAPQTAVAIEAPAIQAPQAMPSDSIVREAQPAPTAPASVQESEAAPVAPAPVPRAASVDRGASLAAGDVLARIERGQTLSQVAAGMDRGGHTLDEAMVALLRANPEAFIGGNIHRVRSGAVLRMPGAADFGQADAAAAAALVREQTAQWRQAARPVQQPADAGTTPIAASAAAAPAPPPAPAAGASGARLEIAPAVAAAGSQATESGLGAGGEGDMLANEQLRQAQEDLATRDSELQELRTRVEDLEKMQQAQLKLIELKDSELAAAQQTLAQTNAASATPGASAPVWLWGGLGLLVTAALVWWLARRPKPMSIPASRRSGFDAAALAAALPQASPESAHADDGVDEVEHVREEAPSYPAPTHPDDGAVPAWHTGASGAAIGLASLNPAPAGRERLELAIAYLDLGDVETARSLLHEVAIGQDPSARDEAAQLLREIG